MRSKLEVHVAQHMDRLGVPWAYELPVPGIKYLPDFIVATEWSVESRLANQISAVTTEGDVFLDLGGADAHWVEVKPQSFIYQLRDHLGVPERTDSVVSTTAQELHDAHVEELWKPKLLAEKTGRDVLVVGEVDRTRTLSVTMSPDYVWFRTDHPFVNTRNAVAKLRKEREDRQWWEDYERRRLECERRRLEREADNLRLAQEREVERLARQQRKLRELGATSLVGWRRQQASFAGLCEICETHTGNSELWVYFRPSSPYRLICVDCDAKAHAVRA
jgi:hypothetical protein